MVSLEGKRILIVEEEPITGMIEEEVLVGLGCDVIGPVQTYDEGKSLLVEAAIDAALVDGTINGIAAHEIAEELKRKNIPFAIITAHALFTDRRQEPPFNEAIFLQRPFKNEELIATVKALFGSMPL